MTKLPAIPAALLALLASAGVAAPAAPNPDVRCLLLSNLYAKVAAAAEGREAATQARLFYLGRVSARLSGAPLQAALAAATPGIDPAQAGAAMNKCLATVQTSAAAVEAAGAKVRGTAVSGGAAAAPAHKPAAAGPVAPGNGGR